MRPRLVTRSVTATYCKRLVARLNGLLVARIPQQDAAALDVIANDGVQRRPKPHRRASLFLGVVESVLGEVKVGQIKVGVVLFGPQRQRRAKVGRGLFQVSLMKTVNATGEEQDVTNVVVRVKSKRRLKIFFRFWRRVQFFIRETAEQISPDEIGLLRETSVEASLCRFTLPKLEMADCEKEAR